MAEANVVPLDFWPSSYGMRVKIALAEKDELGDKPYFGGEDFGYVDVALVPFTSCFYTVETCGKLSIEEECPKLLAWPRGAWKKSVAKSLPHPHQIYAFAMQYKQRHGLE
ncbi:hypothetical protein JHK82_049429 [Glycine max]|nr:hypothetical protein JHK82_049429 [Glycine max]